MPAPALDLTTSLRGDFDNFLSVSPGMGLGGHLVTVWILKHPIESPIYGPLA